ncbi:MAG: hypothetical protein JSW60_03865 [Thermoplasmatales archaeon]|nr:MAG: hypothetical protein JSW60_03865 [Thermoplasmatales archaeon]
MQKPLLKKGIAFAVIVLFIATTIFPLVGSLSIEKHDFTENMLPSCSIVGYSGLSLITIKAFKEMGENGWCVSDVPVIITSESDEIAEIYYRIGYGSWIEYIEPFNISEDGENIALDWYAVDFEGNQSEVDQFTFDIDQTKPVIQEVVWEAYKDSGDWWVLFTCDATDETSGMDRVEMYVADTHYETIEGGGPIYEFDIMWSTVFEKLTFWFYHYDEAGNMDADDVPSTGISPSGLESSLFSTDIVEEDSCQSIQSSVSTTRIVEREKTQSSCSVIDEFNPSYVVVVVNREMGNNDWVVSDVNITIIPDPEGVESVYYKLDDGEWSLYTDSLVISEDGIHSFLWYVIDLEGYSSTPDSISFKVDRTSPEIKLTKKRIEIGKVKFTANVYDETSNIDRVEFSDRYDVHFTDYDFPYEWIWTLNQHRHMVKATVYDNAGNSNSSLMSALNTRSQSSNQQSSIMMFLQIVEGLISRFPLLQRSLGWFIW